MGNTPNMQVSMTCGSHNFRWEEQTYLMGVINLTPDSFSNDGIYKDPSQALKKALFYERSGAAIIDIGAESTRPNYIPISVDEELSRLIPIIEHIVPQIKTPISVDTYKSAVATEALKAGASMVNDIWGLKFDPVIASVASQFNAPLVLMHNQEDSKYNDLLPDIIDSLTSSIAIAINSGVSQDKIIVDPGIGFGKSPDHNLEILKRLNEIASIGYPVLIGTSRKSTIGHILDLPVDQRQEGTAATVALSIAGGANIVRVHDVKEMVLTTRMCDAILKDWRPLGWKN